MNKEFITHELALELKELGFDEPCLSYYDKEEKLCRSLLEYPIINSKNGFHQSHNIITAPLYQQVFRWFRDAYNIFSTINVDKTMEPKFCYSISRYETSQFFEGWYDEVFNSDLYYTYEEAELDCLKKLIEIVKK